MAGRIKEGSGSYGVVDKAFKRDRRCGLAVLDASLKKPTDCFISWKHHERLLDSGIKCWVPPGTVFLSQEAPARTAAALHLRSL